MDAKKYVAYVNRLNRYIKPSQFVLSFEFTGDGFVTMKLTLRSNLSSVADKVVLNKTYKTSVVYADDGLMSKAELDLSIKTEQIISRFGGGSK